MSDEEKRLRAIAQQALRAQTRLELELAVGTLLYAALAHEREALSHWRQLEWERKDRGAGEESPRLELVSKEEP